MCILCAVQRWSRGVATMLPWLVIPLILLWAASQILPPHLRFEITSPRLACVSVLLVTLFWYEVLMPRLSAWRARRSSRIRERRRAQALEMQKLRKAATRRCRNCLTPYRDQNPGGGRFMCSYCGHISKRPVLDLPGGSPRSSGVNGWICGSDWPGRGWNGGSGDGSSDRWCMTEKSYSGVVVFTCKLLSCIFVSMRWLLSKVFRISSSIEDPSDGHSKGLSRKGENGGNYQESRGEKARRKAEEKKQARLEKEMLEEEERKQREEVARLVEERRKLRDEILEAERIHSRGFGHDADRDRRKEAERRRQERKKEKDKGSSKSNSDVEEFEKRTSRENEKKREFEKKSDGERQDSHKFGADKYRLQALEPGNATKAPANKPKYFDRVKGSFLSSSKGFSGASFFGRNAQSSSGSITSAKPIPGSIDHTQSRKYAQFSGHATGKIASAASDKTSKSIPDRSVGSEVRSSTPAPKKSWHQLFTHTPAVSPCNDMNTASFYNQNGQLEAQSACRTDQIVLPTHSFDNHISLVQPSPFSLCSSVNGSFGGNLVNSMPDESMLNEQGRGSTLEEAEVFEDPCYVTGPFSLSGPVSDSLDNFPLDLGAGFVACSNTEEPHNIKKIPASVDVRKPSPIESPISRSRAFEEKLAAIDQLPTTPKIQDKGSNSQEQGTWQMWGTPSAQDALGVVAGLSSWFLPQGQQKSYVADIVQPPFLNPMISQAAAENYSLAGTSQQNGNVDMYQTGGSLKPLGHDLGENDKWMQEDFFQPLPIDDESQFPPLNLMDSTARSDVIYEHANGLETQRPFELSPVNCWSKNNWALQGGGLQESSCSTHVTNSISLFSSGPDVQSVWASAQREMI